MHSCIGLVEIKNHFMRKLFFVVALLIVTLISFAQTHSASFGQNSFFAEAGGAGIMFSANLDHRFTKSNLGWGGRIGAGFVTAYEPYRPDTVAPYTYYDYEQSSAISVPLQINYIFGKENSPHTFEVGAGFTYVSKKLEVLNFYDDKLAKFFGTFSFMYRRQPKNGGFSWRAGFTPVIAKSYIQPFGALSLGYNF